VQKTTDIVLLFARHALSVLVVPDLATERASMQVQLLETGFYLNYSI